MADYKGLEILGRSGIIGVMLGMLILIGAMGFGLYKLSTNHITHAMETSMMFTEVVKDNTKVLTELTDAIHDLK